MLEQQLSMRFRVPGSRTFGSRGNEVLVAIPARNEAETIPRCLTALAEQTGCPPFTVVTYLNNCTDMTISIVSQLKSSMPYTMQIFDEYFPPAQAHAGMARRMAMQCAAKYGGPGAVLLTTDADSQASPDWISGNLAAIEAGADAVAGMAEIDATDEALLPSRLVEDERNCDEYATLLDEIDWLLDPDVFDPWPRHTQHAGASIAVRAEWHLRVGGIPPIPLGEDRLFFEALRRADARIRHAPNVVVTVSGRMVGRAKGGMADTIVRRLQRPDLWIDDCLEPARDHLLRAMLRSLVRAVWCGKTGRRQVHNIAAELALPYVTVDRALGIDTFGQAWSTLELQSPRLNHRRVAAHQLPRELNEARRIVQSLRGVRSGIAGRYRYDNALSDDARIASGLAVPAE